MIYQPSSYNLAGCDEACLFGTLNVVLFSYMLDTVHTTLSSQHLEFWQVVGLGVSRVSSFRVYNIWAILADFMPLWKKGDPVSFV